MKPKSNSSIDSSSPENVNVPLQDDPEAILLLIDMIYFLDFRDVIPS